MDAGWRIPVSERSLDPAPNAAPCNHNPSVAAHPTLPAAPEPPRGAGIRSDVNISQENTVSNYACCRGADHLDNLINSVKTLLICDDLKPPYKSRNSPNENERGDETIAVEMDLSRMCIVRQQVRTVRITTFITQRNVVYLFTVCVQQVNCGFI